MLLEAREKSDESGNNAATAEELARRECPSMDVDQISEQAYHTSDEDDPQFGWRPLFWVLVALAIPLCAENLLHIFVGLTDTYLANNVIPVAGLTGQELADANRYNAAAAAAVGSTTYVLWFMGLMTGAVGTGSTALIARATGANDRRTARSAVGQSLLLAFTVGCVLFAVLFAFAHPISRAFGLSDPTAQELIATYLRIVSLGAPMAVLTFVGNACLRGAGDTITPAIAMIVIDIVNIVLSFGLCYGMGPFPKLGFAGIAWGTALAYGGGAFVVLAVLLKKRGRNKLRLFWHRLRPNVKTSRRILKIGIPSGAEGLIFWGANFVVLFFVNTLGVASAAAHNIVIRLEAFSYMTGFAISTAAATMVGQSVGMGSALRARRSGTLAYAVGGGAMTFAGIVFIVFAEPFCSLMSDSPKVVTEAARCLRIAGFSQIPFAAMMIYGGSLRGAGDTTAVMTRNLGGAIAVRMLGAVLVVKGLGMGLIAVWFVLTLDMFVRGGLLASRFYYGKWTETKV